MITDFRWQGFFSSLVAVCCAFGARTAFATPSWLQSPPRIVQTLWREPDVAQVDVDAVVAHARAVRANCIVLNGGGVMDFFHHEHAMAKPSAFLPKNRDVLANTIAACHRAGIRVLARIDFRGVEEARFRLRPEWFAVDADGTPVIRESGLHQTCFNGGYRNEYGLHLIRLLLERYRVDGFWYNSVQSPGACYCPECERKYRAATGETIPRAGTEGAYLGPQMATYRALKAQWALEHLGRVRAAIKAAGADRVLSVEIFGMYAAGPPAWGGVDVATVTPAVDFLLGKAFVGDEDDLGYAGSTVRFLRALDPAKPVVLLSSTNRNKFRLIAENPAAVKTSFWEAVAAGGGIWNALVAGPNPDTFADHRNARTGAAAFAFLEEHGDRLGRQQPVTEAKIYFSTAARTRYPEPFATAMRGAERVLAEHHVPYGYLPDTRLDRDALAGVKVVVVPSAALMSEAEATVLREFVREGGTLIADFQTSLYDLDDTRRKDFALADVFGVSFRGRVVEQTRNSPHKIRRRPVLLTGWEETELLLNGGRMALCRTAGAEMVASRVPPPPGAVPEESWIRELETDDVTIAMHRFGRGQAIYFAHEIMRQAFADRHPDFGALLASAINVGRGKKPILTTNAPPTVRLSLLGDGAGRYTLSLVNHAPAPVHEIEVTLQLPQPALARWRALKSDAPFRLEGDTARGITIRLPKLADFAAVEIETQ